jgi:hypothetical protein
LIRENVAQTLPSTPTFVGLGGTARGLEDQMVGRRRRGFAALIGASMLLTFVVGSVQATAGTYTVTFCYDATNTQISVRQVWAGMDVDELTGGIGSKKGGFGFDDTDAPLPATSGDLTNTLFADPHAKIVGADARFQGVILESMTINKVKGSWAKTLPGC